MNPNEQLMVNVQSAAAMLAISRRTMQIILARGDIPCVRVGRAVRIAVADLRAWIDANRAPAGAAR